MPQLPRPKEGVLSKERSDSQEKYHQLLAEKSGEKKLSEVTAKLEAEEADQLERLFQECDKNQDGVVDFEEFRGVMELLAQQTGKKYNYLQLKGMFRLADT